MRKRITLLLTLTTLVGSVFAQNKVITPRPITMPHIDVKNLGRNELPVRISEVKTDVVIVGTMAVTTVEMTFHNPNQRILEGELQFPLNDGQTISRFALDINGKLREGVVVDKAKGQEAFEAVIRQRIDPGLLERTQGNNFRTRVYPLPANGTRRIAIAYEQELLKTDGGYRFHLPVQYGNKLDKFDVNLKVFTTFKQPEVTETPWGAFSFNKVAGAYVASHHAENYDAKGQIVFAIPDNGAQKSFVEKGKISGDYYFYANVQPQIKNVGEQKNKPSALAIYWDSSASMANRDFEKEAAFLDEYFKTLDNVKVFLHTFNCQTTIPKTFIINNGNWDELKEVLRKTQYDGATQFGALDLSFGTENKDIVPAINPKKVFERLKPMYEPDEVLFFSDGLSNFGYIDPILGTIPVHTINSLLTSDNTMLRYMASATGGKNINLVQQTPTEAASIMKNNEVRFLYASYNKDEVSEMTPSASTAIAQTDIFSVAGKLNTPSAKMTLHFGIGKKSMYTETIEVKQSEAYDYDNIVERVWAEKMIGELDLRYEKNKEKIESIGKTFNIVTRNTSLIVLDRVEDYVRYEIVPPVELLDEYNRQISSIKKSKFDQTTDRVSYTINYFEQYQTWWNKVFPKTCAKNRKQKSSDDYEAVDMVPLSMTYGIAEDIVANKSADNVDYDMVRESVSESQMSPPPSARSTVRFTPPLIQNDEKEEELQTSKFALSVSDDLAKDKVPNRQNEPSSAQNQQAKIELKTADMSAPYMKILAAKSNEDLYRVYLDIKEGYKTTPSFYLDVAKLFEERGMKEQALVILSNIAELEVENYRLMRVLAHRLNQLGYTEYAMILFDKVLKLRPNEPQSLRDLALAYDNNGEYQKAVDTFYKVIEGTWDGRAPEIETIVADEMNRTITLAKAKNVKLDLSKIDKRLIKAMPVDIRIVLNWDTDNSDMDLWIVDPCGEECGYNNPLTHIGGTISADFTQGYGPEVFKIKSAMNGKYKIKANYFGTHEQTIIGATTAYLDIYTYYGSGKEKKESIIVRLDEQEGMIDIGEIVFSPR